MQGTFWRRNQNYTTDSRKKNKETGEVEKVSYAFSLVFQSAEKTLSDEEVNIIMKNVTDALNAKSDWQVR